MTKSHVLWICLGPLIGHGLASGIMNPGSVSAAGAFVGAGLFGIAIALCRDPASTPVPSEDSATDGSKVSDTSPASSVKGTAQ